MAENMRAKYSHGYIFSDDIAFGRVHGQEPTAFIKYYYYITFGACFLCVCWCLLESSAFKFKCTGMWTYDPHFPFLVICFCRSSFTYTYTYLDANNMYNMYKHNICAFNVKGNVSSAIIFHDVIICIFASWKCDFFTSLQLPIEII